jgi:hypothetical protein
MVAYLAASFVKNIYFYGACLWTIIFAFGYIEPLLMGIMLNMVSPLERSTAISVTTFLMMTFGPLPAPYVYGQIHEKFIPPECN